MQLYVHSQDLARPRCRLSTEPIVLNWINTIQNLEVPSNGLLLRLEKEWSQTYRVKLQGWLPRAKGKVQVRHRRAMVKVRERHPGATGRVQECLRRGRELVIHLRNFKKDKLLDMLLLEVMT